MPCRTGSFSLVENCLNELTGEIIRFPCQPIVCDVEDGDHEVFPQWAWPLIVVGVLAVLGFLTFFYLKKKCDHTLTVVAGFVLAATLKPPMPQSIEDEDVEAARTEEPEPSAPPSYNEAISATPN